MKEKMEQKRTRKKVLVVGIDGGTFSLIDNLVKRGILPNIKSLRETGVCGNLRSTIPPITGPAWVAFATGKNAGKHGCHNFLFPKKNLDDIDTISRETIKGKTFYEYLDEDGKKSIIVNLPCSFPPKIDSIFLASFLTREEQLYYPKELSSKIKGLSSYRIVPSFLLEKQGRIKGYIQDVRRIERKRFNICKKLLKNFDWDLFFVLISSSDWVQHKYYTQLVQGSLGDDHPAVLAFKDIDEYIGWYMNNLGDDTDLVIISDHGFSTYKGHFYINKWLEQEGFLKIIKRGKVGTAVTEQMLLRKRPILARILGFQLLYRSLGSIFRGFYSLPVRKILPKWLRELGEVGLSIDLKNSKALSIPGNIGIYVNDKKRFVDGCVDADEYEALRDTLIEKMKRAKDKDGDNIFTTVWKKEEIYSGSEFENMPDIQFSSKKYNIWSGLFYPKGLIEKDLMTNEHDQDGIFMAIGPNFKTADTIKGASLLDIAPTLLYLLDSEIPKDLDGSVLKGAIKQDLVDKREIKFRRSQKTAGGVSIRQKIQMSDQVLLNALRVYSPQKTAMCWTGGKDSTLILWLTKRICERENLTLPRILFIDEGDLFDEVSEFINDIATSWGLKVETVRNDDVYSQVEGKLGALVYVDNLNERNRRELQKLGFTDESFVFEPESFVGNHLMKTVPMNVYIEDNDIKAVITGIRWDEQEARADETYESPREDPPHMRIHPILHFLERDIWEAIHTNNIPYNKLYQEGFRSLGARTTTTKADDKPAWEQDLQSTTERKGRRQDKEKIMKRLRDLGYM